MGVLLIALALVTPAGVAGFLAYLVGHGLVKAALFMIAGICLAGLGGVDEIGLRGAGRGEWAVGIAAALGGLLLGGLPVGIMDEGTAAIDAAATAAGHGWVECADHPRHRPDRRRGAAGDRADFRRPGTRAR